MCELEVVCWTRMYGALRRLTGRTGLFCRDGPKKVLVVTALNLSERYGCGFVDEREHPEGFLLCVTAPRCGRSVGCVRRCQGRGGLKGGQEPHPHGLICLTKDLELLWVTLNFG